MREFSVIVRLGHKGVKGIEVERWCQAHNAIDAGDQARSWGAVKSVLAVIPLAEDNLYARENRGEQVE